MALLTGAFLATPVAAEPGALILASTAADGTKANNHTGGAALTPDGTALAFASGATNLLASDTDAVYDIYIKDLATGGLVLASTSSAETKGNGNSFGAEFDADGSHVVFQSIATNLLGADTDDLSDIYVKDLVTGEIVLVSTAADGTKGDGQSHSASFSPDGDKVAFATNSTLVAADDNFRQDLYVKDLATGAVALASAAADGTVADFGAYGNASFSDDGTKVAFSSPATNLTTDSDADFTEDVFVKNLTTGAIELASTAPDGTRGNGENNVDDVSSDGSKILFASDATNLHAADTDPDQDSFIKDLTTGAVTLVSASSDGTSANGNTGCGQFSGDETRVLCESSATNLHPDDTDSVTDVFVKDLTTGAVLLASVTDGGVKGNVSSVGQSITADGTAVSFVTESTNLDPRDTDDWFDAYVKTFSAATPPETVSETVAPGGTATTDSGTPGPSEDDPVETSVTSPQGGAVTITERSTAASVPTGYTLLGQEVEISAPAGTAAQPLQLVFFVDDTLLPAGADATTLQVFRNGSAVSDCTGAAGTASPDPCVSSRQAVESLGQLDYVRIAVLTSAASVWNFGQHDAFDFTGFFQPVDNPPTWNVMPAGRAVPVDFRLGGNHGTRIFAAGSPSSAVTACTAGPSDRVEKFVQASASGLAYRSKNDTYSYTWKTDLRWRGCRVLTLKLIDGTTHTARFMFQA